MIGQSAGGNLAAVMALLAKERGQRDLIKAQVLVSPLIDAADLSRPSYKQFQYGDFMNKASIEV